MRPRTSRRTPRALPVVDVARQVWDLQGTVKLKLHQGWEVDGRELGIWDALKETEERVAAGHCG